MTGPGWGTLTIRRLAPAIAACLGVAGPVAALDARKPPTDEASAEARRLIADAKAQTLFEDASEGESRALATCRAA